MRRFLLTTALGTFITTVSSAGIELHSDESALTQDIQSQQTKLSGDVTPSNPTKVKTRDWGKDFQAVKKFFGQTSEDRTRLNELRAKHSNEFTRLSAQGTVDMEAFLKSVDADNKAFISRIIDEETKALGIDPKKFSVVTMGSMARQESGLYTDLEIFFVVKRKNTLMQLQLEKLAQKLSDRFFRLGEHPDVGGKGLRMDEAGNSPFHLRFASRYMEPEAQKQALRTAIAERDFKSIPFEGCHVMLVTPEELASYHNKAYTDKLLATETQDQRNNRKQLRRQDFLKAYNIARHKKTYAHMSNEELRHKLGEAGNHLYARRSPKEAQHAVELGTRLMRNAEALYDKGGLFTDYWTKREEHLNGAPTEKGKHTNLRQEIASKLLLKDGLDYSTDPKFNMSSGKLGDTIDLKRELYRIPEQIITNLGFYYNVGTQNGFDIIQALLNKGVVDEGFAKDLKDLMNFAMQMNIKQQSIMKKQGFAIYLSQEKFQKDLDEQKDLEARAQKKISILEAAKGSPKDLNKAREKLAEIQYKIHDIESVAPGKILTPTEVNALSTRYLPMLSALYDRIFQFLGDKGESALKGKIL